MDSTNGTHANQQSIDYLYDNMDVIMDFTENHIFVSNDGF